MTEPTPVPVVQALGEILSQYQTSFSDKAYRTENDDGDLLMQVFGITPEMKRENRQYWGRELGMCWQRLLFQVFIYTRQDFGPALRFGLDEPCDFTVGTYALDTKYRIGSGDSGTLKKFRAYGPLLRDKGYQPILLIVRQDNLSAAITACQAGGWTVFTGAGTYDFIKHQSGFDIKEFLLAREAEHKIRR